MSIKIQLLMWFKAEYTNNVPHMTCCFKVCVQNQCYLLVTKEAVSMQCSVCTVDYCASFGSLLHHFSEVILVEFAGKKNRIIRLGCRRYIELSALWGNRRLMFGKTSAFSCIALRWQGNYNNNLHFKRAPVSWLYAICGRFWRGIYLNWYSYVLVSC